VKLSTVLLERARGKGFLLNKNVSMGSTTWLDHSHTPGAGLVWRWLDVDKGG